MSYAFNFDLSHLPKSFFEEIIKISSQKLSVKKIDQKTKELANKFNLHKYTDFSSSDGLIIIKDLIEIHTLNFKNKKRF